MRFKKNKINKPGIYIITLLSLFACNASYAQIIGSTTCTGSLGVPIVNETFGSGTGFGPPLSPGITNMQYVNFPCPNDGQYTIVNATAGCFGANWHATTDHTGNPNGYFMLINASYQPSDFYVQTVNGLCDGTTYLFSSWVMNMDVSVGASPNITFTVENTNGTILGTYSTGNIPISNPATWNQYGFYFTTPVGVSTVVLRMHNNAPGGLGNDLALDDITFSPAGPLTSISIQGNGGSTVSTCSKSLTFLSTVENCYLSNGYQWQLSNDGGATWADIAGANNTTYTMPPLSSGSYMYRLGVAQAGSIGNNNCRVYSNNLTITVSGNAPVKTIKTVSVCNGQSYTLPSGKIVNAAGVYNDTLYSIQGCDSAINVINLNVNAVKILAMNAFICHGSNYTLPWGKTVNAAGLYNDTLYNEQGCDSLINSVNLTISTAKTVATNAFICQGSNYVLPSGKIVASAGIFYDTLHSILGCDSLITTLNLTVTAAKTITTSPVICNGSNYVLPSGKTVATAGVYYDTLYSLQGCDSLITITNLSEITTSVQTLRAFICNGSSYILPSGKAVSSAGTYNDTLHGLQGCDSLVTTAILKTDEPPSAFLPVEITKCAYAAITITASGSFAAYLWSSGSTGNSIEVKDAGTYWLEATDSNNCKATDSVYVKDSVCKEDVFVPSAFTPNGDGINDNFKPIINGNLIFYHFIIYNRWGQKVFESKDPGKGWDGKLNGKPQDMGTFVWQLAMSFGNSTLTDQKGTVVLIR